MNYGFYCQLLLMCLICVPIYVICVDFKNRDNALRILTIAYKSHHQVRLDLLFDMAVLDFLLLPFLTLLLHFAYTIPTSDFYHLRAIYTDIVVLDPMENMKYVSGTS